LTKLKKQQEKSGGILVLPGTKEYFWLPKKQFSRVSGYIKVHGRPASSARDDKYKKK
jgi:hypothetical protein